MDQNLEERGIFRLSTTVSIWLTTATIIILILILAITINRAREQELVRHFSQQQIAMAKGTAAGIEDLIIGIEKSMILLSRLPVLRDDKWIEESKASMKVIYDDLDGKVLFIAKIDSHGNMTAGYPTQYLREKGNRDFSRYDFFKETRKTKNPYIGPSQTLTEQGNTAAKSAFKSIVIAVPVQSADRRSSGVVIATLSLNTIIDRYVKPIKENQTSEYWVVDDDGILIEHPDKSLMGKHIDNISIFIGAERKKVREYLPSGKDGHIDCQLEKEPGSVERNLITYAPINLGLEKWTIVVVTPYEKVISLVRRTFSHIMLGAIALIIIVLIASITVVSSGRKRLSIEAELKRLRERKVWQEQLVREKNTIEGIIEGSPIPTFVVDKNHMIMLWNRACAELTGLEAGEMIGTDKHYQPFYPNKRPLIADLIIDQDIEGLSEYYGKKKVKKSDSVKGAYEARDFYENLGGKPRHLYFLAAPIFDERGNIIAAVETLQDISKEVEMSRRLEISQEALIREKKTGEGTIEGSPIPTFVVNKEHKVIFWNKACAELTGLDAGGMIGTDRHYEPFYPQKRPLIVDLIIDQDVEGLTTYYGKKKAKKSETVEGAYEARDFYENLGGKPRHLYFLAAPIYNEKGEIVAAIETLQDVSKEVEMSRRLEISQEELIGEKKTIEGIIEGSPIPTFVVNKEHKVILWNKACAELTGLDAGEMVGTDRHYQPFYSNKRPLIVDLILDQDIEGLTTYYGKKKVKKSETVAGAYEARDYYSSLGGKPRHLYFLAAPIYNEKGEIVAAIETLQDVSKEHDMASNLREYAETLENEVTENVTLRKEIESLYNYLLSIVESSPDTLFDVGSDGIIHYISRDVKGKNNLASDRIKGRHFTDIIDPEHREVIISMWEEAKKGIYNPHEIEVKSQDGTARNLLITCQRVRNANRYVIVQRDITEFKNLEKKFYESQKLAAIGQLSAGIAHEIRNPLSSIKMSLQILVKRMQPKGNDEKRFVIALKEVEHLEALVNDVLIYAKPTDPVRKAARISSIAEHALAMAEKLIEDKHIKIKTELEDIPPLMVDAAMLEQTFLNLYRNAIDAMNMDGILTISASLDKNSNTVFITIEDNGCGIDEQDIPYLFNPFFTKKSYGTGLGLSQVKKIIDLHRGTIELQSRKGNGTKVLVTLPFE